MQGVIETQYLPSIEYFCALLTLDSIALEKHEHYTKQSYRNRCYINTTNGIMKLVVPIVRQSGKISIKDTQIDHSTQWQNHHWRSIESAYRKAPFFDHYADKLHPILFRKHPYLYDMNRELLLFCLNALNFPILSTETTSYQNTPNSAIIKDFRSIITPKAPYQKRFFYTPVVYFQIFGSKFVSNLSLIDLLFCEGSDAMRIVRFSATLSV